MSNWISGNIVEKTVSWTFPTESGPFTFELPDHFKLNQSKSAFKYTRTLNGVVFQDVFEIDYSNLESTLEELQNYFYNVLFYASLGKKQTNAPTIGRIKNSYYVKYNKVTVNHETIINSIRIPIYNSLYDTYTLRQCIKLASDFDDADLETIEERMRYFCRPSRVPFYDSKFIDAAHRKLHAIINKGRTCVDLSSTEIKQLLQEYRNETSKGN